MVDFEAVTLVDHSVEGRVEDAVTVDVVVGLEILTLWHVIGAGCVAIWPVTVLALGHVADIEWRQYWPHSRKFV